MVELLEPWRAVVGEERAALERELSRELPEGHVVSGKAVQAIARRADCDDVLFEVAGVGFAVVHLTWRRAREKNAAWPRTELFASYAEWAALRMRPDHADWSTA